MYNFFILDFYCIRTCTNHLVALCVHIFLTSFFLPKVYKILLFCQVITVEIKNTKL